MLTWVPIGDALAAQRGVVIAPAGCGKTQTIVDALKGHDGKPVLILTHTNAGVYALRQRLTRAAVPARRYRLYTLDGWALSLVSAFPQRSGYRVGYGDKLPYDQISNAALRLLQSRAIHKSLKASYSRILIDEYQDCSTTQHEIVLSLPVDMSVCILGDPLQAIFGFAGRELVSWKGMPAVFPHACKLNQPWRWMNAEEEAFGRWLLQVRQLLVEQKAINLRDAPKNVIWCKLPASARSHQERRDAVLRVGLPEKQTLLILGDASNRSTRTRFARDVPGVSVLEPVELPDLIAYARRIEGEGDGSRHQAVLEFAAETMTGVNKLLPIARLTSIAAQRSRIPASELENKALAVCRSSNPFAAIDLLRSLRHAEGTRLFREELLEAMIGALRCCGNTDNLLSAAIRVREQRRLLGRKLPRRVIGSTLLMKGLEADHAIILDADGMNRKHLYVALTRASRSVTIFSASPALNPGR